LSDRPLARAFAAARARGRSALIPFLPAGWPTPAACLETLHAAVRAGADLLELGVPFSDPLADGPSIQRASQRALDQGMTLDRVLALVREAGLSVPVVLMTYLNPVLSYGPARLVADAAAAGVAGVLYTDLPVGAAPELERVLDAGAVDRIRLVAPTTPDERLRTSFGGGGGFIYLIARLGVTGARADGPPDLERQVRRVRAASALPIAVGFGISTPAQVAAAARWADGVVVGSALVDAVERGGVSAGEQLLQTFPGALRAPEAA
jgi:tryptophan synthase alpha chain